MTTKKNNTTHNQGATNLTQLEKIRNTVITDLELPCEIIGSWLWVDCLSVRYRTALEQLGFRFDRNKMLWYWTDRQGYSRSGRNYSMDEIRAMFNNNNLIVK